MRRERCFKITGSDGQGKERKGRAGCSRKKEGRREFCRTPCTGLQERENKTPHDLHQKEKANLSGEHAEKEDVSSLGHAVKKGQKALYYPVKERNSRPLGALTQEKPVLPKRASIITRGGLGSHSLTQSEEGR